MTRDPLFMHIEAALMREQTKNEIWKNQMENRHKEIVRCIFIFHCRQHDGYLFLVMVFGLIWWLEMFRVTYKVVCFVRSTI